MGFNSGFKGLKNKHSNIPMPFVFSITQVLWHSKKAVNIYQSTRRNILEDLNLQQHVCGNL